ncbi:MAG: NlpC/P60 family protein [Candidatus Nanopelagicales bacterium]|nr:NlpC/P60 family protein [Candidatus Nanopelagicales bacterium]
MTPLSHFNRSRMLFGVVILSLGAGLLGVGPGVASPKSDIARIQAQVADLQHVAEGATERYNEARSGLNIVQQKLGTLQRRASRQRTELQKSSELIDALARSAYMSASLDPSLQLLLASDPSAFLAQGAALNQLAKSQQTILRRWQTSTLRLRQTQAEVAQQVAAAKRFNAAMASAKSEADTNLGKAQAVLAKMTAAQRARWDRIKAQARQQALAAAATAKKQLAATVQRPGRKPGKTPLGYIGSGRAASAVRFALSQVGKPYVAAQAGPRSYDCSGLTLAAWRQAGVGLTHYSKSQYSQTRRVPVSQIRPGDLVFYFGSGAHHVGMYVGNGKMVSASNPDDGVELIAFLGPWYRERFSGVGRVI